jgi:beta-glucosidase
MGAYGEAERERVVEETLGRLGPAARAGLLAGQDMWTLAGLAEIGLAELVMSDGPIGVRGRRWTAADPSIALPSPTALAATWDRELARRVGRVLAREAHRKGVHVLLAPTVNLHRSPLGGRHFEAYSEDPYLTGVIGTAYVQGVQDGGVGVTVKHFVANDAETDRFTVDNVVDERTLRELYLAPFEAIVRDARPWGVMAAYNAVNGVSMTEHERLIGDVLRGEWGFDGVVVSDWLAARSTVGAIRGGLDLAMPGPRTVYGDALLAAVRSGEVEQRLVDEAARRVLRLAARAGLLSGAPAAVGAADRPAGLDGDALARELAARGCVLLRNEPVRGRRALPLDPAEYGTATDTGAGAADEDDDRVATRGVALIGAAGRDPRVLGGGSAQVFPDHVVSPLEGLRAVLPDTVPLEYVIGVDPTEELAPAGAGFTLEAVVLDARERELGGEPLPGGQVQWLGDLPEGVVYEQVHAVEMRGEFVPRVTGEHRFGTRGTGGFRLSVAGKMLFDGVQADPHGDPFEAFFGGMAERGGIELTVDEPVEVLLRYELPPEFAELPIQGVVFSLLHGEPLRDADELIDEAVTAAERAATAVVVVATTERVESEGFDRKDLRLPGRQDELVARVAAVNPHTVVVVNAGAPVEMPWREEVAAVLLAWFPGQEAGAALADVLVGAREPGGRLPTTWPARLADAPVTRVTPTDGRLPYDEGPFIGYRAWERRPDGPAPAYPFGHGLGYTEWEYTALEVRPTGSDGGARTSGGAGPSGGARPEGGATPVETGAPDRPDAAHQADAPGAVDGVPPVPAPLATVRVTVRNIGARPGREVVQLYLTPEGGTRRLAGFASVPAAPGATVEAVVEIPARAAEFWDGAAGAWRPEPGPFTLEAARSSADSRLAATFARDGA